MDVCMDFHHITSRTDSNATKITSEKPLGTARTLLLMTITRCNSYGITAIKDRCFSVLPKGLLHCNLLSQQVAISLIPCSICIGCLEFLHWFKNEWSISYWKFAKIFTFLQIFTIYAIWFRIWIYLGSTVFVHTLFVWLLQTRLCHHAQKASGFWLFRKEHLHLQQIIHTWFSATEETRLSIQRCLYWSSSMTAWHTLEIYQWVRQLNRWYDTKGVN